MLCIITTWIICTIFLKQNPKRNKSRTYLWLRLKDGTGTFQETAVVFENKTFNPYLYELNIPYDEAIYYVIEEGKKYLLFIPVRLMKKIYLVIWMIIRLLSNKKYLEIKKSKYIFENKIMK
jgi:hypothetical protein